MIEKPKFKLWYDEKTGLLYADILDTFDAETAKSFFQEVTNNFSEEQQRYFLVHMFEAAQKLVDKETRRSAREGTASVKWNRIAIWGAKASLRMVTKIVLLAVGKANETKFLETEEEALTWLKAEKEKESK